MKSTQAICMLVLISSAVAGFSQKPRLMISDSLRSRADELPVKFKAISVSVVKLKFGEYSVGQTKMGWEKSTEKSKIFSRGVESSSSQMFSFELLGPMTDVAQVNAVTKVETKTLREWVYFSYTRNNFQFESSEDEELLLQANSFTALLTINKDTTDIWTLIMTSFMGSKVNDQYKRVAILTNGIRKIDIVPVTSNENGEDKRMMPACGYEFRENEKALAALQFYGGGMFGDNKNIIWLPREEDPKMKLLLASALTTVLEHKLNNPGFSDHMDKIRKD